MAVAPISNPGTGAGSGAFPSLVLVQGSEQRRLPLIHSPFTVGRKVDKDLVIADPRVSRDHAQIVSQDGTYWLIDQGSKHGTFVNGLKVERHKLGSNDLVEFGARGGTYVIFNPLHAGSNTAREFLSQISGLNISTDTTDLEKLTMFLEAARKLNTTGVLDEILVTLVETILKLTRAERGYVFLKAEDGSLQLAAGCNSKGERLTDDKTFSNSILQEALHSASEFLVTDTSQSLDLAGRQSIVSYDLRTEICIPLRKYAVQTTRSASAPSERPDAGSEIIGALYVDSRFASRDITSISHDILKAIAVEAAQLVENARLVQAEEEARRYQQELSIASSIQQRLMEVHIPEVPFARMSGRNLSCKEIGGDFFDATSTTDHFAVVVADVCGKGVSAALLASTLQGMVYSHLVAQMPLADIVAAVNRFFTQKHLGEKYATVVIARISRNGELEYVNCGHVPPLLVSDHQVTRPQLGNLPVGLLPDATYEAGKVQLKPGDRFIIVTDGVTEAENARGDFYDNERLEAVAGKSSGLEEIFTSVTHFCGGTPLNDDCTVVELVYTG
jgi:sigma-B regulation protein RsbU (phosphoserine phosphatase)